jgi:3',5'-cyclic AMP phosphodiesterase CpdA
MAAQSFNFAVLNDLHYLSPECGPWLEGLVRRVNAPEELSATKSILDGLRVPYYTVPGNHDGPPGRAIGSGAAGLMDYEAHFPNRRNYHFTHKGWQMLGLDTTNGSGYELLPIPAGTLEYARRAAAALDRRLPTILFTHMPLDPTVRFSSSQGYELLRILLPLNLRIVFSGHFHGFTERQAPPPSPAHLKLLTNACCSRVRELHDGTTRRGYFRCRANGDESVSYTFVEYAGATG